MRRLLWCGMGLTLAVAAGLCWLADQAHRCPNAPAGRFAQGLFGVFRTAADRSAACVGEQMPELGPEPRTIDLEPAPLSKALELIDLDQLSQFRPEGVEPPLEECELPAAGRDVSPLTPTPAPEEWHQTGVGVGLGLGGPEYPKVMPLCIDAEATYPSIMPYADEAEAASSSLLDFWMGLFSGPVPEAAEARESEEPPTCPDQAACPHSGMLHSLKTQQEMENEECPRHPEVDTMEARKGEFEYFKPNRPN
jgi:hypothetical protein